VPEEIQRRSSDSRIDQLMQDVAQLQKDMSANTEITRQVRDVLASFRVIYNVAKWLAAIGAGVAAIYHGFDAVKKHL